MSAPCWFDICMDPDCTHERQYHSLPGVDPECNEGPCVVDRCPCEAFVK